MCRYIKLPRNILEQFRLNCDHKISFSIKFKKRKFIIIYLDKALTKNLDALIGLLLHEVSHLIQIDKGIYKNLLKKNVQKRNFNFINKIKKYGKPELNRLFNDLSLIISLTLKDIYANNYLIKKNLTKYLISFYKSEFSRKICPRPFFYDNLNVDKKNLEIITKVFEFELSLLSVILPLYQTKNAQNLINFIERCYEINIQQVSEKCHDLIRLYFASFGKKEFNEEFVNLVFMKVYRILN